MLYACVKLVVVAVMRGYFRLETRGAAHVPLSGPALLVSNHASVLDPPAVGSATGRQLCFMAKAELFRVPVLGPLIRALGARPVRRETASTQALKEALGLLREGRALLMFPEGTRGADGAVRNAKPGAGMLAVMSGAPVVPVYISGTGRALPRGRAFPRPAKIRIAFGPPLVFKPQTDREAKERYREAADEMMRAIERLRDQVEEGAGRP